VIRKGAGRYEALEETFSLQEQVCVCVCVRARAFARARALECLLRRPSIHLHTHTHTHTHTNTCARTRAVTRRAAQALQRTAEMIATVQKESERELRRLRGELADKADKLQVSCEGWRAPRSEGERGSEGGEEGRSEGARERGGRTLTRKRGR